MTDRACITSDSNIRYYVDRADVPSILADIRRFSRRYIEGCQRDAAVCVGPSNLCACCIAFQNAAHAIRAYPPDGRGHRRIITDGAYMEAAAFADRLQRWIAPKLRAA